MGILSYFILELAGIGLLLELVGVLLALAFKFQNGVGGIGSKLQGSGFGLELRVASRRA